MNKPATDQPEHSPKLKMASKEIKDILDKYDIAGVIQLFTPGFNEYTMNLSPSWSLINVDSVGKLHMKQPIVDTEHPEAAKEKIKSTVNMVANMRVHIGNLARVFMQSDIAVRTFYGMMPKPGGPNISPIKN